MKMRKILIISVLLFQNFVVGQEPILINESTIVLDFEESEEFYFSFAEGDIIVFDLEMVKGKHIKKVEVIEIPSNTILTEFKVKRIHKKEIHIKNKGIYKFKFYSSSLTRRVCKLKLHRIPLNESTKNFNTNWKWKTLRDTTYTNYTQDSLVGYSTIKYKETVKELKETKKEEIMLFEKSQKVHSYYNENVSRTYLKVDLPVLDNSVLRKEKLLAWSYWIGVGQESQEAFKENIKQFSNIVGEVANVYANSPLAGLALGSISNLIIPQTGEDVSYYFIPDYENAQLFYRNQTFLQFDMGKGRAAFGRNDLPKQGTFYIGLDNDNKVQAIEVNVKVLVIKEIEIYHDVMYDRERKEPKYVTLQKKRMNVSERKIRIPVE